MTKKQKMVIALLEMLIGTLKSIGDVLFIIWIVHAIIRFDADPSYPFTGLKGLLSILLIYLVALAIYMQQVRLRRKYDKQ